MPKVTKSLGYSMGGSKKKKKKTGTAASRKTKKPMPFAKNSGPRKRRGRA